MPPISSSSSSTSSRISSSQSYFDVYPERRGNRPYTPNQKSISSSLKSAPNSEDDQGSSRILRKQTSPQRSPLVSYNRQESLREDAISSSTSNSWLTVSSSSADLTPSSSSSSLYSTHAYRDSGEHCRGQDSYGKSPASESSLCQRPSASKLSSRSPLKAKAAKTAICVNPTNPSAVGKWEEDTNFSKGKTPVRLKSQKSMPNVNARRYQQSETPGFSWLGSVGKKAAFRTRKELRTDDSIHDAVIDDEDGNDSNSSLDSVGREARSTLKASMKALNDSNRNLKASQVTRSNDDALLRQSLHVQTMADARTVEGAENGREGSITSKTPSPHAQSLKDTQERHIQRYIRSKQLNTLMTLAQAPYRGRSISFADVGDRDGHPVFLFLGLGAVRYFAGLYDEMASILRLRLICIDRWGQGRSDEIPADQCGVLEWSGVVTEVADRLKLRCFSVLAHSAGAPYAMATTLLHSHRIAGPVHLLAPWVSPTIESGYKWLKFVPDGVIKTAQAADSRMQAWKLGLSRPLSGCSQEHSDNDGLNKLLDDISQPSINLRHAGSRTSSSSSPLPPLYRAFSQASLHLESNSEMKCTQKDARIASAMAKQPPKPSLARNSTTVQKAGMSESVTSPAELHRFLDSSDSPLLRRTLLERERASKESLEESTLEHRSVNRAPPQIKATSLPDTQTAPDPATALLKASHSENLARGGSNEILVILGRSSQKPWGFNYTDVTHPVAVWYGDKDERISMTSILWMERELNDCSVKIVKGASHDLMTNASVVVEALESIATHRIK